jgi:hypothetical protein
MFNYKLKFSIRQKGMLAVTVATMNQYHKGRQWWVAGGFLRDVALNKPIKDVDVFVNGFASDALPEDPATDLGKANAYIHYVKNYFHKDTEVNVIFLRGNHWNLQSVADRCDLGICQASLCPLTGTQYFSDRFAANFKYKVITVERDTRREHVERVASKLGWGWMRRGFDLDSRSGFTYNSKNKTMQELK